MQSAGGCCLVVGDQLYFYVSGRQGRPGTSDPGVCSTGLATLRRDGFASMDWSPTAAARSPDAPARLRRHADDAAGALHRTSTVRQRRFTGGQLRVEVLDRNGDGDRAIYRRIVHADLERWNEDGDQLARRGPR